MTLVKYNPSNGLANTGFDRLFDDIFGRRVFNDSTERQFIPEVDVVETDKNFELSVSLPGVDKKDISVEVDEKVLSISGSRNFNKEDKTKTYKSIETHYGTFKRTFKLPENVDAENIKAEYLNGILTLEIAKVEKAKKSIVVKVK